MNEYIWKYYNIKESDYNELIRKVWQAAFSNNNILEPLEDLEMRFALV
jgi:hypothetical protein